MVRSFEPQFPNTGLPKQSPEGGHINGRMWNYAMSIIDEDLGSGGGAVSSVFGRTGVISAVLNDYSASLIENDSGVAGATVRDALNTLSAIIPPAAPVDSVFSRTGAVVAALNDYAASLVNNDSGVVGSTVKDALDTLAAAGGGAWTKIAEVVLGSPAASILFSGIPSTYTDLCLQCSVRDTMAIEAIIQGMHFNGDTSNSYAYGNWRHWSNSHQISVSASSNILYIGDVVGASGRANNFSGITIMIYGYADTSRESMINVFGPTRFGNIASTSDIFVQQGNGIWKKTDVINSITYNGTVGLAAGSRIALYGIG